MSEMEYSWNEAQKQAMQEAAGYLSRLIPAAEELTEEFKGELKEDSYEYLNMVIEGLNWVIQVYNGVKEVINDQSVQIDSVEMDQKITRFGSSVSAHDSKGVALGMEEAVLPFLKKMKEIADTTC